MKKKELKTFLNALNLVPNGTNQILASAHIISLISTLLPFRQFCLTLLKKPDPFFNIEIKYYRNILTHNLEYSFRVYVCEPRMEKKLKNGQIIDSVIEATYFKNFYFQENEVGLLKSLLLNYKFKK